MTDLTIRTATIDIIAATIRSRRQRRALGAAGHRHWPSGRRAGSWRDLLLGALDRDRRDRGSRSTRKRCRPSVVRKMLGVLASAGGVGHDADVLQRARTYPQILADRPAQSARHRDLVGVDGAIRRDLRHAGPRSGAPNAATFAARCLDDRRRGTGQWGRGGDPGRAVIWPPWLRRMGVAPRAVLRGRPHRRRVDAHRIDRALGLDSEAVGQPIMTSVIAKTSLVRRSNHEPPLATACPARP